MKLLVCAKLSRGSEDRSAVPCISELQVQQQSQVEELLRLVRACHSASGCNAMALPHPFYEQKGPLYCIFPHNTHPKKTIYLVFGRQICACAAGNISPELRLTIPHLTCPQPAHQLFQGNISTNPFRAPTKLAAARKRYSQFNRDCEPAKLALAPTPSSC